MSTQLAMLWRLLEKGFAGDNRSMERFLMLADKYSDEEPAVTTGLPAEDERILQVYQVRLLSGAASIAKSENANSSNSANAKQDEKDE